MSEEHFSLSGQVFGRIREGILSGKYAANEELKEKTLGEEFGVSRTPVREALRQLELEGLVSIIPNKGVIMSTAIRAFLIKSKLNQEAIFIFLPPLLSRNLLLLKKSAQIQDFRILPLRFPALLLFYQEGPHDLHTLPHNQGHVI